MKVSKAFVGRRGSWAYVGRSRVTMATRAELDRRAHEGQTVVPGGTGGHSLEAQEHLAQGIDQSRVKFMHCYAMNLKLFFSSRV